MQGASLAQRQQLRAIPVQIQANAILNMSLIELQEFIGTEAVENPALSVAEGSRCPVCGFVTGDKACPVCGASMKSLYDSDPAGLGERAYLERAYAAAGAESTFDPFRTVASTISLTVYLKQQARMSLAGRKLRIAEYLIDSLGDDGYFRESLFETAEQFAEAVPEVEEVLSIVQSFDPPGIAARDLRECLLIQLRSLSAPSTSSPPPSPPFQGGAKGGCSTGSAPSTSSGCGATAANAERILLDHWESFSKLRFKAIARRMDVTVGVVTEAADFIKTRLNPYPASMYAQPFAHLAPGLNAAVVPDVVIRASGESISVEVLDSHSRLLGVDETYDDLYGSIRRGNSYLSDEDCRHIREHVERVKCILEAIALRKKTLTRVATYIADYQAGFLLRGPSCLRPLRQKDVAKALEIHESTICRAVAGKYCRLPSGETVSFEMFFDSALPIRNMIREMIAHSAEPLSDGEIARKLAEQGVEIARRTVAKYREQLRVLPYQLRAA